MNSPTPNNAPLLDRHEPHNFNPKNDPAAPAARLGVSRMKSLGDTNGKKQQILRLTEERGTDYNSRIWILKCLHCLNVYGSNSTDAWERKCPKCQSGADGSAIPTERNDVNWTNDEHILAFRLYNDIPFGTIPCNAVS